jgi:uncharacterized protein YfbU (UPF0304 family)
MSAGNMFYSINSLVNIWNKSNPIIHYYYYGSDPVECPNQVVDVLTFPANQNNPCIFHDDLGDVKSIADALSLYDSWKAEYGKLKDNYFNSIVVAACGDEGEWRTENGEKSVYETLRFLFEYRGHYTDYLSITETYMTEQNYKEALITVEKMYQQFELTEEQMNELTSLQEFIQQLWQWEEEEQSIYTLSENEIAYLVNFVATNTGRGTVFAFNILCELYGICIEGTRRTGNEEGNNENNLTVLRSYTLPVSENITLVPNPTTGELRIEVAGQARNDGKLQMINVEVLDVYGRKLPLHFGEGWGEVNISHLPAGVYFMKINTESGDIVKKVVKY